MVKDQLSVTSGLIASKRNEAVARTLAPQAAAIPDPTPAL